MKKFLGILVLAVFLMGVGAAQAATIDFEGIATGTGPSFKLDIAQFDYWLVLGDGVGSGNDSGVSGSFVSEIATITFDEIVSITGLDVIIMNTIISDQNGTTLFDFSSSSYNGDLATLGVDLSSISKLTFSFATGSAVIDNIEYAATPIPGAAWLLGSGLVGLVGLRRKFMA